MKLRDYQQEAIDNILTALDNDVRRQLVVLATGSGKTVVAAHLHDRIGGKTLFLAHRKELLHQAANTYKALHPNLSVSIEQADSHATQEDDVVVASVPTLGRSGSERIMKFGKNHFDTVIIDEAHHFSEDNSTYSNILSYFTPKLRLGITATPQRGDSKSLIGVFDEIVYFKPMDELIKDGYLSPITGYRIKTDTDISSVKSRAGDYIQSDLSEAVNNEERNKTIVKAYKELASERKALSFCVDVQHAYDLRDEFIAHGVNAATVVGETHPDERARIFQDFRNGSIRVLTGANVFVEGYDEPSVDCVIFARPTKSQVYFSQAIGRGTRLFESKQDCLIIDVADATKGKRPVSLPTLMGLPPDFDLEGEDPFEAKEKYDELIEIAPQEASRIKSLKDVKAAWERIDFYMPPAVDNDLLAYSQYIWIDVGNDTYMINLTGGEKLKIQGDTLGRYTVYLKHETGVYRLGVCQDMQEAFRRSDKWIVQNRSDNIKLIDTNEPWRKQPATDKQLKWLKKFGVPIIEGLSKGEASQMLDKLFESNPKKPDNKPQWLKDKIAREKASRYY